MKIYAGLTSRQFDYILKCVSDELLERYKTIDKAKIALYMYIMKLRTNQTNAEIAPLFGVTKEVVGLRLRATREILYRKFVPRHLLNPTRNDLLNHTSPLSRRLYNINDNTAVVAWDATYMYIISSSNYTFQKATYSLQKKRNLMKFMLCVATDGFICASYGPYEAGKNDATILAEILNQPNNILEIFRPGDVMVVDRGFRDCVQELRNLNFDVKIPACVPANQKQLTLNQANSSRKVTKTRFVIEVRNGHIKNRWKYLKGVGVYQSIKYLQKDFQLGAALINAFSKKILSDKADWRVISNQMAIRNQINVNLYRTVLRIPQRFFNQVNNLSLFPKLSYQDLKLISQGTYQIKQARSYCQLHLKRNNNIFVLNICDPNQTRNSCAQFLPQSSNPLLVMVTFASRYTSSKKHATYVLLNMNANNDYEIKSYCCSCKNGLRTLGCCSHVMTIIWYTLHVDQNNLRLPSTNFDRIFDRN